MKEVAFAVEPFEILVQLQLNYAYWKYFENSFCIQNTSYKYFKHVDYTNEKSYLKDWLGKAS